jgi:hypothetical protein
MQFVYNDGGRRAAGFKGDTGDCVTRAIALATQLPYQTVYNAINAIAQSENADTKRRRGRRSNARTGVFKPTTKQYLAALGWTWHPTMGIGTGCKVHLRANELPSGTIIVSVSRHLCAVIDGVIHDTHNPDRDGTRCVYGYWSKADA